MRVAVAGYGDVTRYICEEFVKAGHELLILTRSHKTQLETQGIAQTITDYSLSSLKAPLADCEVLISTIGDSSPTYTDIHRTLFQACKESPKCKRFLPAEFLVNIADYPDQPGFYYGSHEPIREMLRNQKDVEWTLLCIGWFADYFVPAKNRHLIDIGDWHPFNWVEKKVLIAGTGNEPVDLTWARDAMRGLEVLIKAPPGSWEPYTFMTGERSSWNDATRHVLDRYDLDYPVEHVSLRTVAEMIRTAKDEDTLVQADYYLLSISQACGNPPDKVREHKEKFFPGVHFRTLQEGLAQFDEHPDSVM